MIGVNFGRVGFLSAIPRDELESGVTRVFAGELEPVELTTLEVETGGKRHVAVNDAVVTSGELGRMVELEWSIGGEDFGRVPCDGLICSTPSGSTAYNLSNGGPVLMWGLDAMALTFVAPHDLRARPFVVPRGHDLHVWNRTPDVGCAVLVDGHRVGDAGPNEQVSIAARRAAIAARDAPGGDVRPPLPAELRQRLDAALSRSGQMCGRAAGLPSTRCCAASGSRTSSSFARSSSSSTAGLNVLSGETGAGKTIFAQAIGLLLGVKGDAGAVGPDRERGVRRGGVRRARRVLRRERVPRRSRSCGRRTSRGSCWRGACSETAARGRTRGGGRSHARISRRRRSG